MNTEQRIDLGPPCWVASQSPLGHEEEKKFCLYPNKQAALDCGHLEENIKLLQFSIGDLVFKWNTRDRWSSWDTDPGQEKLD